MEKKNNNSNPPINLDMDNVENHLRNHLDVLVKELKDNNGVPPKHRIEEERRLGLI